MTTTETQPTADTPATSELADFQTGKIGVYEHIPMREYLALDATSSSLLRAVDRSPAHAKFQMDNPDDTPALLLGSATHTLTLEPMTFEQQYVISETCEAIKKNGKQCVNPGKFLEAGEWKCGVHVADDRHKLYFEQVHDELIGDGAQLDHISQFGSRYYVLPDRRKVRVSDHEPGLRGLREMRRFGMKDIRVDRGPYGQDDPRLVLTEEQGERCIGMCDALMCHPGFESILNCDDVRRELTIIWTDADTGLLCKARVDIYNGRIGAVNDVKTTTDARPDAFARTIDIYGLHIQAAHHLTGCQQSGMDATSFSFTAVESEQFHGTMLHDLDPESIALGFEQSRRAMRRLAECRRTNVWPGYSTEINRIGLSSWNSKKIANQLSGA